MGKNNIDRNKEKIQKDIVNSLPYKSHGLLNLAVRVGKTKIAIDLIKKEKPESVLWVTVNTKLRDVDIPEEFRKWKAQKYLNKTTVICYQSLSKTEGKFDKIILDEYQSLTENNSINLFNNKIKYKTILGLTGTHPKDLVKNTLLSKLNLQVLYSLKIEEAVQENLIAPYRIFLIPNQLNCKDKNVLSGNKKIQFYQTEKQKYEYLTKCIEENSYSLNRKNPKLLRLNRMRFLHNLQSKQDKIKKLLSVLKGRTLVFSANIAIAEKLSKYTYHSKTNDKYLNMFLEGKINILSCVNMGGTGFTYKDVDNFVIGQANSDILGATTQKIGRSLVLQDNYIANIFIVYTEGTADEDWVKSTLSNFNSAKVIKLNLDKI